MIYFGLGASFGPTLLLTLWWRKTTRAGVLFGMIVGTVVTVAWRLIPVLKGALFEIVPAFILALLTCVVVSLMTQKNES